LNENPYGGKYSKTHPAIVAAGVDFLVWQGILDAQTAHEIEHKKYFGSGFDIGKIYSQQNRAKMYHIIFNATITDFCRNIHYSYSDSEANDIFDDCEGYLMDSSMYKLSLDKYSARIAISNDKIRNEKNILAFFTPPPS